MAQIEMHTSEQIKEIFSNYYTVNATVKMEASKNDFNEFVWIEVKGGSVSGENIKRMINSGFELILASAEKKDSMKLVFSKEVKPTQEATI